MHLSKKICLLGFIILFTQSTSFAGSAMDEYFNDESNMQKYNAAVRTGVIQKGKDSINTGCEQEKVKNPDTNCVCVKEQISKTSDKEFFYDSILAYTNYQEEVNALRDNDNEKYQQLKKKHAQRKGLSHRLVKVCGL